MTRERGMQSGMFLMWGYDGEEMDDIEATVQHVRKSNPDIFLTTVSYPIKGTPYYKRVADRLVQLEPWGKSSDREFRVKGRHSRQFYAHADKLLRSEVELERMLQTSPLPDGIERTALEQNIQDARTGMRTTYAEVEQ
jgi:anaerobic magnesium-protoporphyrin IX monomethyl ester cyclase